MKTSHFLFAVLLIAAPIRAQTAIQAWVSRYDGLANSQNAATAAVADSAGNIAVAGTSSNRANNDYYTAKYAGWDGHLLWVPVGNILAICAGAFAEYYERKGGDVS